MIKQAITEVYSNQGFINTCKRCDRNNFEDLRSEVIAILFEMPEDKIIGIIEKNYLIPYANRIAMIQSIDERSKFNKQFNSTKEIPQEDFDCELTEEPTDPLQVESNHKKLLFIIERINNDSLSQDNKYFYHSRLALEKARFGSIRSLSLATNIPVKSLYNAFNEYKKFLNALANG